NWHGATAKRILDSGLVDPRNMAWIGVHGLIPADEWQLAHSIGATVVTSQNLKEQGISAVVRHLRESVFSRCDRVYLSVDIGAVDGAEAPGRREITVGALRAAELLELMHALNKQDIRAFDLTEVAPAWDPAGRTQRLAAEAILSFIGPKVLRK